MPASTMGQGVSAVTEASPSTLELPALPDSLTSNGADAAFVELHVLNEDGVSFSHASLQLPEGATVLQVTDFLRQTAGQMRLVINGQAATRTDVTLAQMGCRCGTRSHMVLVPETDARAPHLIHLRGLSRSVVATQVGHHAKCSALVFVQMQPRPSTFHHRSKL